MARTIATIRHAKRMAARLVEKKKDKKETTRIQPKRNAKMTTVHTNNKSTKETEKFYRVQAFTKQKGTGARREFLVKWSGYGDKENEWVRAAQLKQDMPQHFDMLEKKMLDRKCEWTKTK